MKPTSPARALLCGLILVASACGDNASTDAPDAGNPDPDAAPGPDAPAARVGLSIFDFAFAIDISPDGRLAAFEAIEGFEAILYFHDTETDQVSQQTLIGDPGRDLATGMSATGRVSALHADPVQAGLWTAAGGWQDLGSYHPSGCGEDIAAAWDISADGSVAVGMAWNGCAPTAFRWTDASGAGVFSQLELLGTPSPGSGNPPTNRATVVSDDGRIAAGFASNGPIDRTPAIWNADGTGVLLDPTNLDVPGEILSINADGTVAAGIWGNEGFVWTAAGGVVILPRLDVSLPGDPVFANAMSADGTKVFGGVGSAFFTVPIAFVWTAADGMRVLADVATAAGVTIPDGMVLGSVLGASADGTVLVGSAMDADGAQKSFTMRLPPGALD